MAKVSCIKAFLSEFTVCTLRTPNSASCRCDVYTMQVSGRRKCKSTVWSHRCIIIITTSNENKHHSVQVRKTKADNSNRRAEAWPSESRRCPLFRPGTSCDACEQEDWQHVHVYLLFCVNLRCKEQYNRDWQPITTLESTVTRTLCKLLLHQVTLRRKNSATKQRCIQQKSEDHSKQSLGISCLTQCCQDVASFVFVSPLAWTARRKRTRISSARSQSHTSYKKCDSPKRRVLESTIGLLSVSCRSQTFAPRNAAHCASSKLQPQCCGIRHEDSESAAIAAGRPILPCRQTLTRSRAFADAA